MDENDFVNQTVAAWRRHNEIQLLLVASIPVDGFEVVPLKSRGRTVAAQLSHVNAVRQGWIHYHTTGKRPTRSPKGGPYSRADLTREVKESGDAVAEFLTQALAGAAKVRMFGGNPLRWCLYLVSHESHHRGQIALALKQAGMRLPEKTAMQGLWGKWIFGK
jgi:uncharacterized damage-inducible protein DinB